MLRQITMDIMNIENNPHIRTTCPTCSPHAPQSHEVLKHQGGSSGRGGGSSRNSGDLLVRCTECGTTHTITVEPTRTTEIRIIVSKDEDSERYTIELPPDHEVYVEDELLVDDPSADEVHLVEVTSIESSTKRVASAVADEIETIWARAIDEVTVKITIHDRTRTESERLRVYGDKEFVVGGIEEIGRKKVKITRIKTYKDGFQKYAGDVVLAKDVKRAYGETESENRIMSHIKEKATRGGQDRYRHRR